MQNRYTGDIGDFGKLGLLRYLQASGLSIGVNWYLVPNETHNSDGRHVQYLEKESFRQCDEALWLELKNIVDAEKREVLALQNPRILKAKYYSEPLDLSGRSKSERALARETWHKKALNDLFGLDIVFFDPDNGLLVPSASGTSKENKYVKPNELQDFFQQDSSIIYYQHKARKPDAFYRDQHSQLAKGFEGAFNFGLKFFKTSQRYYFFIVHPSHREAVLEAIDKLLSSPWKSCFEYIAITTT